MTDTAEFAQDRLEAVHEGHGHASPTRTARRTAVLIAALAAALAIVEMSEKSAQSEYLSQQVSIGNDWSFFQAKSTRATSYSMAAEVLSSLPNAQDPAVQERIAAARRNAQRMEDEPSTGEGRKQLMQRARHSEELRDHAQHKYHLLEYAVGLLQIAIVVASVSVVTQVLALAIGGAVVGAGAVVFAAAVALHLF